MGLFKKILGPVIGPILILSLWYLLNKLEVVDPIILPSPESVMHSLMSMLTEGQMLVDVGWTLFRVLVAFSIASIVGVPVGLYLGYNHRLYRAIEGPIHALRSIPATALFPLFLIVIGVGEGSVIALATYPSLLVILVNSVNGARLANRRRLYQARVLNLSSNEIVWDVLFYEALPSIVDGLRTAISYALVLVIAVEMFIGVGENGLGRKIFGYQIVYRVPETYAAIIVSGLLGILLNLILSITEKLSLRWVPNIQEEFENLPILERVEQ